MDIRSDLCSRYCLSGHRNNFMIIIMTKTLIPRDSKSPKESYKIFVELKSIKFKIFKLVF